MEPTKTPTKREQEINALRILSVAAEGYIKNLDELTRQFAATQLEHSIKLLNELINTYPESDPVTETPSA